jgi:hypothetical protein
MCSFDQNRENRLTIMGLGTICAMFLRSQPFSLQV